MQRIAVLYSIGFRHNSSWDQYILQNLNSSVSYPHELLVLGVPYFLCDHIILICALLCRYAGAGLSIHKYILSNYGTD